MKRMITITMAIGLLAMAATMTFASASAMAAVTPEWVECEESLAEGTGQWSTNSCSSSSGELNWETREVLETRKVTSSGTVEVSKKSEKETLTVKCTETTSGWIAREGTGEVSSVSLSKCSKVSGTCEPETEIPVKAFSLPWKMQLSEVETKKIRNKLTSAGGGPGYEIECKGKIAECHGTLETAMSNTSGGEVLAEFNTPEDEKGKCGTETERVKGSIDFKGSNGSLKVQQGQPTGTFGVTISPTNPRSLTFMKFMGEELPITIRNGGSMFVELESETLEGTDPAGYSIQNPDCLNTTIRGWVFLLGSASCTFKIRLENANAGVAKYKGKLAFENGAKRSFVVDLFN
jgi:hypothetical protein